MLLLLLAAAVVVGALLHLAPWAQEQGQRVQQQTMQGALRVEAADSKQCMRPV